MTEQGHQDLMRVIGQCAEALQSKLLQATGSNEIQRVNVPRRRWMAPGFRSNLKLNDIYLNDLPRFLYGGEFATAEQIDAAWYAAVEEFVNRVPVKAHAKLYPNAPFTSPLNSPATALVQFMCVAWWGGGRFTLNRNEALLYIGDKRYGLDQRVVLNRPFQTRLPRGAAMNYNTCLNAPIGKERAGSHVLGTTYQYLLDHMPNQVGQLDVVFSTLVKAGVEFENHFLSHFDVALHKGVDHTKGSAWDAARFLINTSVKHPCRALWEYLEAVMAADVFKRAFGDPLKSPVRYTEALRAQHKIAIDQLEAGTYVHIKIKKATPVEVDEDALAAAAAQNYLKLQQMIGL